MKVTSMEELFMAELKDLYDAEHQLVEALPKLSEAATDPDLKKAFDSHLVETRGQVARLERVFRECEEPPKREKCDGMKGLIKEGEKAIDDVEDPDLLDAALIAAAQKVEHYEISAYGTLITWARDSGWDTEAGLLEESLEEEKAADQKLSDIAESGVNSAAEQHMSDEDEGENADDDAPAPRAARTTARSGAAKRANPPARSKRARK
jgi:ferritin-like metal-binding protein YciE